MSDERLPELPGHRTRRVDGGAVEFIREAPVGERLDALERRVAELEARAAECTCAVRQ
jgi:hypothetical protein